MIWTLAQNMNRFVAPAMASVAKNTSRTIGRGEHMMDDAATMLMAREMELHTAAKRMSTGSKSKLSGEQDDEMLRWTCGIDWDHDNLIDKIMMEMMHTNAGAITWSKCAHDDKIIRYVKMGHKLLPHPDALQLRNSATRTSPYSAVLTPLND